MTYSTEALALAEKYAGPPPFSDAGKIAQRAKIEAMASEITALQPAWQDISTAPRDGTEIIGDVPGIGLMVLHWGDGYWREKVNMFGLKRPPKHWIPISALPSAPKLPAVSEEGKSEPMMECESCKGSGNYEMGNGYQSNCNSCGGDGKVKVPTCLLPKETKP